MAKARVVEEPIPLTPLSEVPQVTWINVNGRVEHEAILRDSAKCQELGLDQYFETMVYLKRWGNWLA